MVNNFDVIIVGAGPAGLFAAHELAYKSNLRVLVIDQGRDINERKCFTNEYYYCRKCSPCNIMSGVGGAGTLSSGLLNLRPEIGGNLIDLVGSDEAWQLVKYVDSIFLKYGAPENLYYGDLNKIEELERKAAAVGAKFIPIPQRHIGSDKAVEVIRRFKEDLEYRNVKFMLKTRVTDVNKEYVQLEDGTIFTCKYLILAPGRIGATWLAKQAEKLGIPTRPEPIDIGVRVEVPAVVMDPIINVNKDPKFHIYTRTYDDFVRTFCVNHKGFVVQELYDDGSIGVNGHSFTGVQSSNTNFAFLVRVSLTEPLEDTTAYGISITRIATILGGGKPILQKLGDLKLGRRSTWKRISQGHVQPTLKSVTPGDISMVLPHRILTDILEGLEILDQIIPGVASSSTLLYAPEVKFSAKRIETNANMGTPIPGIYAVGDGAGASRGIVVAAATGIIAARDILSKEGFIR
ncbi:MAG: NAD(P)/FAD-dependent oxidoreductase [Candidatus Methanomethylicia archaeon]|nr:NAD(P)/FAD-dependent oxidoreductase [Candidatus Methanomethylicia archaeon]MCX8169125.1 NAD(P)/FAD-dependent oxidoreductase [Candidatus Methanomethylicia archaeon]MDW7988857.1 NAD(P)/FAD-dependent oxidoreductase [Nitrososphaerota archaeon]